MEKIDTSTEAVTKLLDGVTPGPWAYNVHREVGPLHTEDGLAYGMICDVVCEVNFDADHMGNARFIAAARDLVPALLAERDALKAEVERLKAQPAQAVKGKRLRYFDPQGDTLDQMRDHARQHPLAKKGDMKLVWANEDDLCNHVLTAIQPVDHVTVQDAAKAPEARALIEASYENGLSDALCIVASIGYGATEDVDRGHEDAYRAIEKHLADWKASAGALRAITEGKA